MLTTYLLFRLACSVICPLARKCTIKAVFETYLLGNKMKIYYWCGHFLIPLCTYFAPGHQTQCVFFLVGIFVLLALNKQTRTTELGCYRATPADAQMHFQWAWIQRCRQVMCSWNMHLYGTGIGLLFLRWCWQLHLNLSNINRLNTHCRRLLVRSGSDFGALVSRESGQKNQRDRMAGDIGSSRKVFWDYC